MNIYIYFHHIAHALARTGILLHMLIGQIIKICLKHTKKKIYIHLFMNNNDDNDNTYICLRF